MRRVFSFVNTPTVDLSGSFDRISGIGETFVIAHRSPGRVIPGLIKRKFFSAPLRLKAPRKASYLRLPGRPFCGLLGGRWMGASRGPGAGLRPAERSRNPFILQIVSSDPSAAKKNPLDVA